MSAVLILLAALAATAPAAPAPAPSGGPCRATEAARALDFWVGDWDVYVQGQLGGHDQVTRELNGCAVVEHWTQGDPAGAGQSLFAFDARKALWTQTWVTANSSRPGGIKYKVLRSRGPGTTTFQGEIDSQSGPVYYDRTTLTRLPDGSVRQVIEASHTGAEWHVMLDAIYVRAGSPPPPKA